ncbi:MAG TPA: sigma-70 family RNA polymerase sigma factor [Bryobacteraceae bacterium]|nr:sigma-70 family RNA polymerase sigma factor [Bryobacteraceae bacterium]
MIFRSVEDADLIRQAGARSGPGAVEAFNLLVSRWEKPVYNYLLRLTANREDALDLTQDVFLKAYQNLRKLEDPSRFAPWLYRIAHNEAYSLFRKRRPEAELPPDPRHARGRESGEKNAESPSELAAGAGPAFPIELTLAVTGALNRLSPDQREAVVLKFYQGFKFEEMAEILGCPVSTIKSRLYTALEILQAELAPIQSQRGVS